MFDTLFAPTLAATEAAFTPPAPPPIERWLAAMLDEIDYGMLLVSDGRSVLYANHVARSELDHDHPLQLLGSELRVRRTQDLMPLRSALADAAERGLRRLVLLGEASDPGDGGEGGDGRVTLSVVPLSPRGAAGAPSGGGTLALLVFGKRRMCPTLSAEGFARSHRLTPAETRVLVALCEGQPPARIAAAQGVALSTVRSQIGSVRAKTGAASIRALVRQVAVLPPLVGALRCAGALH